MRRSLKIIATAVVAVTLSIGGASAATAGPIVPTGLCCRVVQ